MAVVMGEPSSDIRIFCKLKESEHFKIVCLDRNVTSFNELLTDIQATLGLNNNNGGRLYLVVNQEMVEVEAIRPIRDEDRFVFVPNQHAAAVAVQDNNRNNDTNDNIIIIIDDDDDDDKDSNDNAAAREENVVIKGEGETLPPAVVKREPATAAPLSPDSRRKRNIGKPEKQTHTEEGRDESDDEKPPEIGTRYFLEVRGFQYPVEVVMAPPKGIKCRAPSKGECCVQYIGRRGRAWVGHSGKSGACVFKCNRLLEYTPERVRKYNEAMGDKDAKDGEQDCTNSKNRRKKRQQSLREESESEEEEEVGTRYFLKVRGVDYPVEVASNPPVGARQKIARRGECYIKYVGRKGCTWPGYKGKMHISCSRLLPYTQSREQKYKMAFDGSHMGMRKSVGATRASAERASYEDDPQVGSRYFLSAAGHHYLVQVVANPPRSSHKKIARKGECYVRHIGRPPAWKGYKHPAHVKVNQLLEYTEALEQEYSKAIDEDGEDDHGRIWTKEAALGTNRAVVGQRQSDPSSQDIPHAGSRYFLSSDGCEYPVEVRSLPSTKVARDGECYVKFLGYRSKKVVPIDHLLSWTSQRESEYEKRKQESEKKSRRKTLTKRQREVDVSKSRAVKKQESRKRAKEEEEVRREEEQCRLYGPPTNTTGLQELYDKNDQEGRMIRELAKNRLVYFTYDNDTVEDIGRRFQLDVEKILYDNSKFTLSLTKTKRLQPCTPIVIPLQWQGMRTNTVNWCL